MPTPTIQLMATLPHSGERIPPEAKWLLGLDEVTLMGDVDRYVDRLYEESLIHWGIPFIKTEWHRYAADLNRLSSDIDADAVKDSSNPPGTFPRGFHWVYNTKGEKILFTPLSQQTHLALVRRVYDPFHRDVQQMAESLKLQGPVVHLDLHSMPSVGTDQHRDPGEHRKDIVISDSNGKSGCEKFKDLILNAFIEEKFSVSYNWPYYGGRITEHYGHPEKDHHVIQIELNRSLYMDERTKQLLPEWRPLSLRLKQVLGRIKNELSGTSSRL